MRRIYKKIESWIWIILLIGALAYFHWLLGDLHSENEKFKEYQEQSKQLQTEIQAQFNETTQNLLKFLKTTKSLDSVDPVVDF